MINHADDPTEPQTPTGETDPQEPPAEGGPGGTNPPTNPPKP